MTRLALAAALLVASTSLASAGTYVGLGIGTSAGGSMNGTDTVDGGGRSGRLMIGSRFGKLSIEGQGGRFDMQFPASRYEASELGVGLKLNVPIGNNFELFGRGGIERTWLTATTSANMDAAGNGWFLGGGVEYRLNLGLTAASLFLDYQRTTTSVTADANMAQFDASAGMFTLGATLSI
jgi:hypothetical protein